MVRHYVYEENCNLPYDLSVNIIAFIHAQLSLLQSPSPSHRPTRMPILNRHGLIVSTQNGLASYGRGLTICDYFFQGHGLLWVVDVVGEGC